MEPGKDMLSQRFPEKFIYIYVNFYILYIKINVFKAGIPGTSTVRGKPGRKGSPGQLLVRMHVNCDQRKLQRSDKPKTLWKAVENKLIRVDEKSCKICLGTGTMTLNWDRAQIQFGKDMNVECLPEMIAAAFTIPSLWVRNIFIQYY